jgi:hypothetical protein
MSTQEIERYFPLYVKEIDLKDYKKEKFVETKYSINKKNDLYVTSKNRKTSVSYFIGDPTIYDTDIDLNVFSEIMLMDDSLCNYINKLTDVTTEEYKSALLNGDLCGPLHLANCSRQSFAMLILRHIYNYYMNKLLEKAIDNG